MMTTFKAYWVCCDRCGAQDTGADATDTAAEARRDARRQGWRIDPGGDLCPACRQAVTHGAEAVR